MDEKFSNLFMAVRLRDNHVAVREGWFPLAKNKRIPYRSIASVEVSQITKRLVICTNDGREYKYAIGGFGKAQRCRDAIIARL